MASHSAHQQITSKGPKSHNSVQPTNTFERSTRPDDRSSDGPSADDGADSFSLLPPSFTLSFHLLHRPNQANEARTSSIPSCTLKCRLIGGVGKLLTREG